MTVILIIIGVIILLKVLTWIVNKLTTGLYSKDYSASNNGPTSKDWWLLGIFT